MIYVAGPASPQKKGSSSRLQQDVDGCSYYHEGYIDQFEQANMGEMEINVVDDKSDDDFDPAYQQHLDDQEPGPLKRKRRPQVS